MLESGTSSATIKLMNPHYLDFLKNVSLWNATRSKVTAPPSSSLHFTPTADNIKRETTQNRIQGKGERKKKWIFRLFLVSRISFSRWGRKSEKRSFWDSRTLFRLPVLQRDPCSVYLSRAQKKSGTTSSGCGTVLIAPACLTGGSGFKSPSDKCLTLNRTQ